MTILLWQKPLTQAVRQIVQRDNGALFDPSDMTTLYQDAAGTTPVTALEQPVGLMLDKSQGLMLGPELVNNGTFDSGTEGWWSGTGYAATITATDGVCSFTSVNSGARIRPQGITTSIGAMYTVTITILSLATTVTVRPSTDSTQGLSGTSLGDLNINSAGTYTFMFKARTTTTYLWVINNGAIGTVVSLDNISVRELYGYHATQSITASRPTLSARKNILLATEALATQSVTTLAAQYTLSFTGTGSVTLSGAATGTLTGTGTDKVSLTFTPTAGTLTLTVSGSVTKAQVELGAVAGPYQRVTTSTNYDTDERYFPKYLKFDAVDDYLNLPFMNLYGGGAASIICARDAVSQTTDAYIISERSTTDADPKYFPSRQVANAGNMDAYITDDAGAVVLDTVGSPFSGVTNTVIRSIVDSGNNLKLFKNGALASNDNYTRSGTLTLNNTTIDASVSTTTSNYASMKMYGLIVTKSALTDAQRIACEQHLSRKSGVQL